MNPILVKEAIIQKTLSVLQEAGMQQIERVLLWLAPLKGGATEISEVYIPLQVADVDYFHIPREGVVSMLQHLKAERLKVIAQVHSHPKRAFHSPADDRWTIINHLGALSLVLPYFAMRTAPQDFRQHAVVFEMSFTKRWNEIASHESDMRYRIVS